jgi:Cytochrome P450
MVRAGETVVVSLNAANRDPELFADAETLRLDRAANRHIAFGHGPHHCPGAAQARLELQEFLRVLLREFPDLRLGVAPDDVQWRAGALVLGPRALPLAWGFGKQPVSAVIADATISAQDQARDSDRRVRRHAESVTGRPCSGARREPPVGNERLG